MCVCVCERVLKNIQKAYNENRIYYEKCSLLTH